MTVSSWFRSSIQDGVNNNNNKKQLTVKEAVRVLYPATNKTRGNFDSSSYYYSSGGGTETSSRSRFSQLILEHGEKPLQDWAVVAYSSPSNKEGRRGSGTTTQSSHHHHHGSSPGKSDKIQWLQSPAKTKLSSTTSGGKGYGGVPRRGRGERNSSSSSIIPDKDSVPSAHMTKIEGRLHLCTGSLVFEPVDSSRGIVRCPFAKMDGSPVEHPADESGYESMCVEFHSRRHLVVKANNTIGPYETVSVPCRFRFTFLHSSPTSFVDLCQKLFEIMAGKNHRSSAVHATPELDALIKPMLDRPFDPDNLVDVREQVLTSNLRCSVLTPLQSKPGILVMTLERIYFQAATGVLSATDTRAESWRQRDVLACARRYTGLRDSALEIYWKDETSTLFAFERRHDREQVMRFLPTTALCFTDREFVIKVVCEWQKGGLSNYEYLLALNSAAGRSFNDLSRYPVFPWVIADFESDKLDLTNEATFRDLSKPVGALNKERLEYFQTRLHGMQDMEEAFLYGTHYSAPGYVLYFLIRSMPEHMLCLQNGKFDAPDRMFHSISQCYQCALTNHADVKELIPEFYDAGHSYDFLINVKGLQLGATQNGDRVNDVSLPKWARSARDFIKKNRKALESEICTRMLPRWIDLIFGCKSRGEGAMEADNVFHHNAYLGPTDLAGMQSEQERFTAELQATEFGIVPDMLFCGEHPLKNDAAIPDDFVNPHIGRASSKDESGHEAWELLDAAQSHETTTGEYNSRMGSTFDNPVPSDLGTTNLSAVTAATSPNNKESWAEDNYGGSSTPNRTIALRGTGEGPHHDQPREDEAQPAVQVSNAESPRTLQEDSPKVQLTVEAESSDWDLKVLERKQIHSDAISGCVLLLDETETSLSILVTTSLDGGLMVHKVALPSSSSSSSTAEQRGGQSSFASSFTKFSYQNIMSRAGHGQAAAQSKLSEFRSHSSRDPLASLVLASDGAGGSVAFAGGHDDVVLAYGIKSACAVASVYSHRDAVTGLDLISRTPFDAECAIWLENSTHIMVSGSWDATVKVWCATVSSDETVMINREPLAELFDADSSIVCVSAKSLPTGGIVIAAGCTDGSFCVWNVHSDGVQVLVHSEPAKRGSGPCSVVKWAPEAGKLNLFAAFSTGRLSSYTLAEGILQRQSAVSLGVAITSLVYAEGILLAGCADGGLRLVPVCDGTSFESKPTLWTAVNNKSTSPGISSISLNYYTENGGAPKCVCCTGAEDGSIVLFELKKVSAQMQQ